MSTYSFRTAMDEKGSDLVIGEKSIEDEDPKDRKYSISSSYGKFINLNR